MSNNYWFIGNKEVRDISCFPEDTVGFVYLITNKSTGERYIGKKILLHKKTRPPLKGKKRKRVSYVESDWKKYTGSNSVTKKWSVEECSREILQMCKNKTLMTYYETKYQFQLNVLEDDTYLNDNINGKFYRKTLKKYL